MKISLIYKGVIIEESLEDNRILNQFKISGLSITKEENWNDRWHIYAVEGPEKSINKLKKLVKPSKWYAHFWTPTDMVVVFRDKVFKFKQDDVDARNKAIQFGLSMGIPEDQLNFLVQ